MFFGEGAMAGGCGDEGSDGAAAGIAAAAI
jgi:hypothetical protein